MRILRRMGDAHLEYVEQPILMHGIDGLAQEGGLMAFKKVLALCQIAGLGFVNQAFNVTTITFSSHVQVLSTSAACILALQGTPRRSSVTGRQSPMPTPRSAPSAPFRICDRAVMLLKVNGYIANIGDFARVRDTSA